MSVEARYFPNPFDDEGANETIIDTNKIKNLIKHYVDLIVKNAPLGCNGAHRLDLYVGDAGIAYMLLNILKCQQLCDMHDTALEMVTNYVDFIGKTLTGESKRKVSKHDSCAFICGDAGTYAVAAVISANINRKNDVQKYLNEFKKGFEVCKPINFSTFGSDELLVGRAGYLSGIYWLNRTIESTPPPLSQEQIIELCQSIFESGRKYSIDHKSAFPLMYQYHGTEYLGAAHGLSSILHMMLVSPWFRKLPNQFDYTKAIPDATLTAIKTSIDKLMDLQEEDGNFPVAMDSIKERNTGKRLVHWCHGAAGIIYLFAQSYRLFNDDRYLNVCKRAADLCWTNGLLRKGPGICHGVAGNGYVFLLMYRLTTDKKWLYRAHRFNEFLSNSQFLIEAETPDRPFSLYEGLAGTICFLIDLLNPENASFPFMDVFF